MATKRNYRGSEKQTARKRRCKGRERSSQIQTDEEGDVHNPEGLIGTGAITLRNQQYSPLLRLPAELRETIWAYAFGCQAVHPISSRTYYSRDVGRVTYHACKETLSDRTIYELSLQGADDENPFMWKAKDLYITPLEDHPNGGRDGLVGVHHRCVNNRNKDHTEKILHFGAPLVCKQMYYEAMPVVWRTSTFIFHNTADFTDFIKSRFAKTHLIQRLVINPRGFSPTGWKHALTPAAVGSFSTLQALHLVIDTPCWHLARSLITHGQVELQDFMKAPPHPIHHIPHLITQFQQLNLRSEQTTVWIPGPRPPPPRRSFRPPFSVAKRLEFAKMIRQGLLDYHPRRRSQRAREAAEC